MTIFIAILKFKINFVDLLFISSVYCLFIIAAEHTSVKHEIALQYEIH